MNVHSLPPELQQRLAELQSTLSAELGQPVSIEFPSREEHARPPEFELPHRNPLDEE